MPDEKVEKQREANRKSYHKHRDERLAARKQISDEEKERRVAYQREWRKKKQEYLVEYERKRWAVRGEAQNAAQREKRKAMPKDEQSRIDAEATLRKNFGLSLAQYEQKLTDQGGHCALCPATPRKRRLHIDHNHGCCPGKKTCGKCVRGLLCGRCNMFVGIVETLLSDEQMVERAKMYLNSYKENA